MRLLKDILQSSANIKVGLEHQYIWNSGRCLMLIWWSLEIIRFYFKILCQYHIAPNSDTYQRDKYRTYIVCCKYINAQFSPWQHCLRGKSYTSLVKSRCIYYHPPSQKQTQKKYFCLGPRILDNTYLGYCSSSWHQRIIRNLKCSVLLLCHSHIVITVMITASQVKLT